MKKDLISDDEHVLDIVQKKLSCTSNQISKYISLDKITPENFSNFLDDLDYLWDFLDYDLLSHIITSSNNRELNNMLEIYQRNLEHFCGDVTVRELINYQVPRLYGNEIPDKLKLCVTELSWHLGETKVKAVTELQKKLKDLFQAGVESFVFYSCDIHTSYVRITWLVWTNIIPHLKDEMRRVFKDNSAIVTDNHISYLRLDKDVIYSSFNNKV